MNGKQANLVVTDPPYNVNYESSAGKIKNDNLENDKFYQFLLDAFTCMEKAMANDASIYVFHADTEGLNFRKAFLQIFPEIHCFKSYGKFYGIIL